ALLDRRMPARPSKPATPTPPKDPPYNAGNDRVSGQPENLNGGGDGKKPAFAAEAAREYHEQRGNQGRQPPQAKQEASDAQAKQKAADILIRLATDGCELFHSQDDTAFAYITVGGHHETWPITTKAFKRWLAHEFFLEAKGAPGSEAMQAALNVIS